MSPHHRSTNVSSPDGWLPLYYFCIYLFSIKATKVFAFFYKIRQSSPLRVFCVCVWCACVAIVVVFGCVTQFVGSQFPVDKGLGPLTIKVSSPNPWTAREFPPSRCLPLLLYSSWPFSTHLRCLFAVFPSSLCMNFLSLNSVICLKRSTQSKDHFIPFKTVQGTFCLLFFNCLFKSYVYNT